MDASSIVSTLAAALPGTALEAGSATDRPTIRVPRERLSDVARALRDLPEFGFTVLTDIVGVDRLPASPRFKVIYHLLSPSRLALLRLETWLPGEEPHVPTLSGIWSSANWLEREVWDLFGIVFDDHPDLRRLLMPDDWEGHPLRKDYPVQIRMKPQVYEPLQMTEQEFQARIAADRHVRGRSGGGTRKGRHDA